MRALLVILLPALLLAACGQKGALYLPNQAPSHHHRGGHTEAATATSGAPAHSAGSGAAPLAASGPAPMIDNPNPPPTGGASSGTP